MLHWIRLNQHCGLPSPVRHSLVSSDCNGGMGDQLLCKASLTYTVVINWRRPACRLQSNVKARGRRRCAFIEIFPKSLLRALTGKAKPIWSSLTYRYTLLMTSSHCSHCLGLRRLVTSFFALKRRLLTVFSRVFSSKPHVVAHTSTPHSPFNPSSDSLSYR